MSCPPAAARPAPLPALLVLTFLCALGTGSLWTGLPFVAEHDFHFTRAENLGLAGCEAVVYVLVALVTGGLLKRLGRAASPRAVLAGILVFTLLVCLLPLTGKLWGLLATALGVSAASAVMWPIIEGYLTAGRHDQALRGAVGVFNVVWTIATAAGLVLMAPVFETDFSRIAMVAIGPCCALGLLCLPWLPSRPPPHALAGGLPDVPPVYRPLRAASRMLLPTSYLLIGTLGPMLPYITSGIGLAPEAQTPVASTWHAVRVVAMLAMWRVRFWHGRWVTLAVGAALMGGGFLLAMGAASLTTLLAALVAFGAGQAVLYYASLYYAMSVGRAEIEAAGTFEALVGLGYVLGPVAGLAGLGLGGAASVPHYVLAVAALAALLAAREWVRWRRAAR